MEETTDLILRGIPKSVGPAREVVAPVRVETLKDGDVVVFEGIDLTIWSRNSCYFCFDCEKARLIPALVITIILSLAFWAI